MVINKAKYSGFCSGVKKAVETVYSLIVDRDINTRIYTLGKLIHNKSILNDLYSHGVTAAEYEDIDEIYNNCSESNKCVIVIRAHGIPKSVSEKLDSYSKNNQYFSVADCTCRDVKKIHDIVSEHSARYNDLLTIIIGDENHPEVEAIKSYTNGKTIVCSSADDLEKQAGLLEDKNTLMIAQTTQKLTEWKKCQTFIQKVCTNPLIFDTICNVTENRQSEVNNISKNVDMMLVIGDKTSSNTNKLYEISLENLQSTYFIETISDLPLNLLTPHMTVGIAAGASTPGGIIEEVIKTMSENVLQENKIGESETGMTKDQTSSKETNETFADMVANSLKTLYTGETVKGTITSISPNEIHVDLMAKVTGIIPVAEISDNETDKLDELYKVGDEIEAIVVKVSDLDGVATLSKKRIDNINNWKNIVDANKNGTILEGKIIEAVRSGVIISINGVKVFIPASQTNIPKEGDLNSLVGTTQRIKIIEINEPRKRAVASIRVVARDERKIREEEFWVNIEKNKKYDGVVKSLTAFGAFVDLGGVDGMVHSSELSWRRIKHPSDVVNVGDTLTVFVKDFNKETKKISLGYKTEETNPWFIFTNAYKADDVVSVKIVNLTPFGAFAEITPGVDGLIHISQITDHKINHPSDVLTVGQIADAKIVSIDMEKHKISLSIKALLENIFVPVETVQTDTEDNISDDNRGDGNRSDDNRDNGTVSEEIGAENVQITDEQAEEINAEAEEKE